MSLKFHQEPYQRSQKCIFSILRWTGNLTRCFNLQLYKVRGFIVNCQHRWVILSHKIYQEPYPKPQPSKFSAFEWIFESLQRLEWTLYSPYWCFDQICQLAIAESQAFHGRFSAKFWKKASLNVIELFILKWKELRRGIFCLTLRSKFLM